MSENEIYQPSIDVLREYNSSGNEMRFEEIISNLKFLSKVQNGNKINISTKEIINNSYISRFNRTRLGVENRTETLRYIRNIIRTSIEQYYVFLSHKERFYHQLAFIIKKEIIEAKKGIENLAKTYSEFDDNNILVSDFEAVLTSINVKLQLKNDI